MNRCVLFTVCLMVSLAGCAESLEDHDSSAEHTTTVNQAIVFEEAQIASALDQLYLAGMSSSAKKKKLEYTLSRRANQVGHIRSKVCIIPYAQYSRDMPLEERNALCTQCSVTRDNQGTGFLSNWNTLTTADHVTRPLAADGEYEVKFSLPHLPNEQSTTGDRGDYYLAQQLYSLGYPKLGKHQHDPDSEYDPYAFREQLRNWTFKPFRTYAKNKTDDTTDSRDIAMLKTYPRSLSLSAHNVGYYGFHLAGTHEWLRSTPTLERMNLPAPGVLFGQHNVYYSGAIPSLMREELFDEEIYGAFMYPDLPSSYYARPLYTGFGKERAGISRPGYFTSQTLYEDDTPDGHGFPSGSSCYPSVSDDIGGREITTSCSKNDQYANDPASPFVSSYDVLYRNCAKTSLESKPGTSGGAILAELERDYWYDYDQGRTYRDPLFYRTYAVEPQIV